MVVTKDMVLERWDYLDKVYLEIGTNTYEILNHESLPTEYVHEVQCLVERPRKATYLYQVGTYINHYKILLTGRGIYPITSLAIFRTIEYDDIGKFNAELLPFNANELTLQTIKSFINALLTWDLSDEKKLLISRDVYNYYIYKVEGRKDFCYAPTKLPRQGLFEILEQSRVAFLERFADRLNEIMLAHYTPVRCRLRNNS